MNKNLAWDDLPDKATAAIWITNNRLECKVVYLVLLFPISIILVWLNKRIDRTDRNC